ncbi:MAG: tRNA 2-thiouridine(34) synthase MnmA [bacterium]|nr:tRNA 2-thiouridine(34) synthase MnmA [bacterium]
MDKIRRKNVQKVVVAMSGGIDSSVAAALLKKAGYDVIGVFMKFWEAPDENGLVGGWNRCCSPESEARARKVAAKLKIPFYVFNFEKEFKKRIVNYFLKENKRGLTPNPCVVCNKEIKFGLLLEKALKLNADFIATGHYAKKIQNPRSKIQKLLMAKDKNKDQSYFLWRLNQKQLKRVLFPIGDYTRKEVEGLAKKFKLSFLTKVPKSQEICFVKATVEDFLKRYLKTKPGKIVALQGKELGTHQGLWFYTIGQRKGIGLPGGPYFVLDKDIKENALIVTKDEKDLYKKELIAKNIIWISGRPPKFPLKIKAKIRYRHKSATATIYPNIRHTTYKIRFEQDQRAITPGQSVVFYLPAIASTKTGRGQELLGGGVIV